MNNVCFVYLYRCRIPECDSFEKPTLNADWLVHAMPSSTDPRRCSRYAPRNVSEIPDTGGQLGTCSPDFFDQNVTIGCEEWVFGNGSSIVKEVC